MLREEYNQERKTQNLSRSEIIKIKQFGERNYYNKKVSKYSRTIKSYNHLGKFSLTTTALLLIPLLLIVILSIPINSTAILFIVLESVLVLYDLIWYLILRPYFTKKLAVYKVRLDEIKQKEVDRQKIIQSKFIKNK